MRYVSLCLLIAVPVVSSVSTPCRLASTARNPVIATSYAIAGKENVPGSSSLRAGPHLANHCIVCSSVLPAPPHRYKPPSHPPTPPPPTPATIPPSHRHPL